MPATGPPHVYAYDLVGGRYGPVADAPEELTVTEPFDIRPPLRDLVP